MKRESRKPRIYIDNRGNWFQDGIRITHKWTYLANNRNLDIDEEGNYFIDEGRGRVYVQVEDTPFVIRMVYRNNGDIFIRLNDGTEEKLDLDRLYLSNDNIPYTTVKKGKFKARFLRQAYYELTKHAVEEDDGYYLSSGGSRLKLAGKQDPKI